MGFFDELKNFLFFRKFNKASVQTDNTYHINLSVTTIGILFDGTTHESRFPVEALITELRDNGHEVYPLGYIDNYSVASTYPFKHFYRKHLNFYYIPKHPDIEKFLNKNYTILLNLSPRDNLTMHYLSKITNAEFKVGPLKENMEIYDLMIQPGESQNTKEMISSIKKILKTIQYKHE